MNIVTWNLNHRICQKVIPDNLLPSILRLKPDIVVFTEFVDGPKRGPFHNRLQDLGFHTLISNNHGRRHNQILIASRIGKIKPGKIFGPEITDSFPSNVLHGKIGGLNIFGIRIPDYSKSLKDKRAAWDWLLKTSDSLRLKETIIIGDLNTDPTYSKARCGDRLAMLSDRGWTSCTPISGHSYRTNKGHCKKIDHAFLSQKLKIKKSRYVEYSGSVRFIGPGKALSDHAPLLIQFERI